MKNLILTFKNYIIEQSGVNLIIFAMLFPALMLSGALAIDLANAYNVRNKLAQALDKAALAAASSTGDQEELIEIAERFVAANFNDGGLGTIAEIDVQFIDNKLNITARARVDMLLMKYFGQDFLNVRASTEVTRELSGIEVVLVLDVTGSMAGTNIAALRTASTEFVNTMFEEVSDPDLLKIGIVPYSSSVNVGPYGLGEDLLGGYYGAAFVDRPATDQYKTPANIDYDPDSQYDWHGCVLAEDYPDDTLDDTSGGFEMYRYANQCVSYSWWYGCTSWRNDPNYLCPSEPILPMTSDQDALLSKISALQAQGSTYGNFGMIWGWRVISPEEPFEEGVEYDDPKWEKAVVMMTDGDNVMNNWYSAYGLSSSHNLDKDDMDERFGEICENMKDNEITIYTITFQSGVDADTRQFYEDCATDPSMYAHAPGDAELEQIFDDIANQLSKLHLSK